MTRPEYCLVLSPASCQAGDEVSQDPDVVQRCLMTRTEHILPSLVPSRLSSYYKQRWTRLAKAQILCKDVYSPPSSVSSIAQISSKT